MSAPNFPNLFKYFKKPKLSSEEPISNFNAFVKRIS